MAQRITFKEEIEEYLKVRDEIDPIVNEIRNQNKSINDIPEGYKKSIIQTKVQILNNKDEYFNNKQKFEAAVKYYMKKKSSGIYTTISKIAEFYDINHEALRTEILLFRSLGKNYQYDRRVKATGGVSLSYQEEQSLLESSKLQITNTGQQLLSCSCRTCFLLKLSTFAYEFAVSNNKKRSSYWNSTKHADILWLTEFEMRNSSEISIFCSENCTL